MMNGGFSFKIIPNRAFYLEAGAYSKKADGNFYLFHREEMTWVEAHRTCSSEAKGAQLPIFTNDETTKFLRSALSGKRIWIGGTDVNQEGKWVWTYGDGGKKNITTQIPWGKKDRIPAPLK